MKNKYQHPTSTLPSTLQLKRCPLHVHVKATAAPAALVEQAALAPKTNVTAHNVLTKHTPPSVHAPPVLILVDAPPVTRPAIVLKATDNVDIDNSFVSLYCNCIRGT